MIRSKTHASICLSRPARKTRSRRIAACFLLLTALSPSRGETKNESIVPTSNLHQWGAVTLFHGLPSNHVRAIVQDSEGVMWFGTDSGLAKYDGRRIQRVASDLLPTGRVRALKLDSEGALWVGTDTGAARTLNGEFRPIAEAEGASIASIITPERGRVVMAGEQATVFDCSAKPDGTLAIQMIKPSDHALLTVDPGRAIPVHLTSLAMVNNALLIGTRSRGLLSIERREVKEINSRPRAFFVEALETDSRGRLWLGAQTTNEDSGLYASGDSLRPIKVGAGTGTINALKFDRSGDLWVATDGQGAFLYRDTRRIGHFSFENTAGGLRSNHIYAIFIDREGVVWFGTDRGVCRYDPQSLRVESISDDAESNFVRTLFESADGSLWGGTNRGLFVRGATGWQEIEKLKGQTVHCIAEDSQGRLLVGTAMGLFVSRGALRHPKGEREFARIEGMTGDNIRAIRTFQGAIYIANFGSGIERIDGTRRTLVWPTEPADARERQVTSLWVESNERVWVGTAQAGVFILAGRRSTTDPALDKLRGAAVRAIEATGDGLIWFASERGLYRLRSKQLEQVIEGSDVRSIITPDAVGSADVAFCATAGEGLYKVLFDKKAGILTAKIDTEHGLPAQNVFAIAIARAPGGDEAIWIGTNRGVARYKPSGVAPLLVPVRAIGKRIFSREEMQAGLSLDYPQNSLAVDVAATSSRTFPEQFQYSFSLFDSEGRIIKQRLSHDSQMLTDNLRPGQYRIEARAFTSDLVSSAALAFEFNIARAPFPWTSTALSLLLALALAAVWWGYRQNRTLFRTNTALEGANHQLAVTRLQLANETEAERSRIARDLHDQTLADLRRLMMMTDQLPANMNGSGQKTTGKKIIEPVVFRGEIESISTEIRRICEDLSPSALANVGLAAALEWAIANGLAHLPNDRKFEYQFDCDDGIKENLQLAHGVQIQIYRIVQEAVSNVCRHSAATRVRLAVLVDRAGDFIIQLEDNGRGFDITSKSARAGRGLTNIRSRASLIEADACWTSGRSGGTLFVLRKSIAPGPSQTDVVEQSIR
jgi:signal transduction histidine kinase/streptogramin lyase